MENASYTREQLEGMNEWRATFRHVVCIASPVDRVVCLMKNKTGYLWRTPGHSYTEECDLERLQKALTEGRLEMVNGTLPRGVKTVRPRFSPPLEKKVKVAS